MLMSSTIKKKKKQDSLNEEKNETLQKWTILSERSKEKNFMYTFFDYIFFGQDCFENTDQHV